ncbi:MAG: hypothetical protein ACRDBH_08845 [Bosea sp. (in: a-proteobacteria)]
MLRSKPKPATVNVTKACALEAALNDQEPYTSCHPESHDGDDGIPSAPSIELETKLHQAFMAIHLALQIDPSKSIYDENVDLSDICSQIRPVILSESLGGRAQALVTGHLAADTPSVDEVRLISAAMAKMGI